LYELGLWFSRRFVPPEEVADENLPSTAENP